MSYLCQRFTHRRGARHSPARFEIGIAWPTGITEVLSPKDDAAPSLNEAQQNGLLADYATCRDYYDMLRSMSKA